MSLDSKLKAVLLEELRKADILGFEMYAKINREILHFLHIQGIIDDSSIEAALEEAVFRQARKDYAVMTAKGRPYTIYADHVGSPECLAYALSKGTFSQEEIKAIRFDHGDSAESFPRTYGKENLLSLLREELLYPTPLFGSRYPLSSPLIH